MQSLHDLSVTSSNERTRVEDQPTLDERKAPLGSEPTSHGGLCCGSRTRCRMCSTLCTATDSSKSRRYYASTRVSSQGREYSLWDTHNQHQHALICTNKNRIGPYAPYRFVIASQTKILEDERKMKCGPYAAHRIVQTRLASDHRENTQFTNQTYPYKIRRGVFSRQCCFPHGGPYAPHPKHNRDALDDSSDVLFLSIRSV